MTTERSYQDYLASEEWANRRARVLRRDRRRCRNCGSPAEQVHHKTYDRIFCENDNDLVSLCDQCHALEHDKANDPERQRRRQNRHRESEVQKLYRR